MKKYHRKVIETFITDIIKIEEGYLIPAYNLYVLFLIYSKSERLEISITSFIRELKKHLPKIASNIYSIDGYRMRCYSGIRVVIDKIEFQFSHSSVLKDIVSNNISFAKKEFTFTGSGFNGESKNTIDSYLTVTQSVDKFAINSERDKNKEENSSFLEKSAE